MPPPFKSASRPDIVNAARTILRDGKPRTARVLVDELESMGLLSDKASVNSVLCTEGRKDFVRDPINFTYSLAPMVAPQSSVKQNPLSLPSVASVSPSATAKNASSPIPHLDILPLGANTSLDTTLNVPAPRSTTSVKEVPAVSSVLSRYFSLFNVALSDEITAVRRSGGQKTYLSEGRYLGASDDRYVYSFTADSELRFPDDTPIDLEYRGAKHNGIIRSVEGFDIVLALESHIGDNVATAILYTAPWFLLEELKERLSKGKDSEIANRVLAYQLLSSGRSVRCQQDLEGAHSLLQIIEDRLGSSFGLNAQQIQAVATAIASPITFIWGPPGTGKTTTLGATIAALVEAGETVLVMAHSNAAVDVAMHAVARCTQGSVAYKAGRILRYGGAAPTEQSPYPEILVRNVVRRKYPQLMSAIEHLVQSRAEVVQRSRRDKNAQGLQHQLDQIKKELEPLRQRFRELEGHWVRAATVVGCTFSKATISPDISESQFSAVIIDEASMAYIPHCAFAAMLATRRVCIFGDFRQLAPIAQSDTPRSKEWLQRDIFEAAGITDQVNKDVADPRLVMLQTQHRMHPAIASVPNTLFYGSRLQDAPGLENKTKTIVASAPAPGYALSLHDLTDLIAHCFSDRQSYSRFNPVSAIIATQMAYDTLRSSSHRVGIITPYNAQSRLIYRMVRDVEHLEKQLAAQAGREPVALHDQVRVATVHKYQGSEQDIILFDTVEGPPKEKIGRLVLGDMDSGAMRLANVAISRARGKFIALANYPYIRTHLLKDDAFRRMLDTVATKVPVQKLMWPAGDMSLAPTMLMPGVHRYSSSISAKADIDSELQRARAEVAIYWPRNIAGYHFSTSALRAAAPNVRYFATVPVGDRSLVGIQNARIWESASRLNIGLVGIDQKQIWLYLDPKDRMASVLRVELPGVAKLLYAYWRLIPDDELQRDLPEDRAAEGKSPLGRPCPRCGGALWLSSGRYGSYLTCTSMGCGYTKAITPADATDLARLMGIRCGKCDQQVKGHKAFSGVFLGCTNYPSCTWTKSLDSII